MGEARTSVLAPAAEQWDYGDFPYGLEPLVIPPCGYGVVATVQPADLLAVYEVERASIDAEPARDGVKPSSSDALYWFRWITGHQVTFLLWHLMGAHVKAIAAGRPADEATLTSLESYTHGYSTMLGYSGSCPVEVYQTLIRPRLYLQHRGFSGLWAADFAPLRRLLRGHEQPWMTGPAGARLAAAIATNLSAHEALADRLVSGGKSLLQERAPDTVVRPSARTTALFDNLFVTLRAPVDRDTVIAQLFRRLRAVRLDLATNRLDPAGSDEDWTFDVLRRVVASALTDRERLPS
ncbi:hypothetical protein [Amycolatopsis keratiniphila]|uniref:hypothetical protein n=1 Tax=Amycolatopsis keratiniphila TaxID=129921 RepID=UPI00087DAC1E|nr:hypothetical protein [Amycolatopsis keratiniphila]OLZ43652.1 hypothetical protein BS330_42355 [Amycolatopsis keratiniphila subsp. nogabecina]SDU10417.1 hypothetical protein SAMN04489733_1163 [Amycolatopsis keratiniphila]